MLKFYFYLFLFISIYLHSVAAYAFAPIPGVCGTTCRSAEGGALMYLHGSYLAVFLGLQILIVFIFYILGYYLGKKVEKNLISVSLSRKLLSMIAFGINFCFSIFLPVSGFILSIILMFLGTLIFCIFFITLSKPFRENSQFLQTVFSAIHRPEDYPNTIFFLITEVVATSFIIISFFVYISLFIFGFDISDRNYITYGNIELYTDPLLFSYEGFYGLMLIPILVAGIGDGLAEIVGKKWGRFHYRTQDIFGKKEYTRTLEGSLMVFLTTIVVSLLIAWIYSFDLPNYFWIALVVLPFVLTLTEAKAPHSWDGPFIYLAGYTTILLCMI